MFDIPLQPVNNISCIRYIDIDIPVLYSELTRMKNISARFDLTNAAYQMYFTLQTLTLLPRYLKGNSMLYRFMCIDVSVNKKGVIYFPTLKL